MEHILSNDLLSGGLVLVLVGSLLAYLRPVPRVLWQQIKSRIVISLTADKGDAFYEWIENWIADQRYTQSCRRLYASAFRSRDQNYDDYGEGKIDSDEDKKRAWTVRTTPAPGSHFFWYKRRPVWYYKEKEKMNNAGKFLGFFETVEITLFSRNKNILESLLEEIKEFNVPKEDDRIGIYINRWDSWRLMSLVPPRSSETVVLRDGILNDITADIQQFIDSREWYLENSIPYRRGYLLYGPPGNGKSSVVMALASHFGRDIYIVSMGTSITDTNLSELLLNLPKNALLLIEDVDQAFREQHKDQETQLTRSGFLNILDGVGATTGRILFMTTNFYENLDQALTRPGRADVSIHINEPDDQQIQRYLGRFLGSEEVNGVMLGLSGNVSMASLQGEIIRRTWDGRARI